MKIHRFINNFKKEGSLIKITDPKIFHQLKKVLKIKSGEVVILSEGNGIDFSTKLKTFGKDFVEFEILEERENQNEPKRKIFLFAAILKRENFEFIIQKGTEIGVEEFFPIITERTVKLDLNLERLRKIAKEASEQSGRGIVPLVNPPLSFADSLQKCRELGFAVILNQNGKEIERFKDSLKTNSVIGIIIGPEGGWSPREIEEAEKFGIPALTLGRLTLRAETSAILGAFSFLK